MKIGRTLVDESEKIPAGMVIGLPGRGVPINEMYRFLLYAGLEKSIIAVIEPRNLEWYPQPFGANDQHEAVSGCKKSFAPLKNHIRKLCKIYKIPYKKVAIVGYSSGGVMALELAQRCKTELAMFISLAGAILDPSQVPLAKHNTEIVLKHNKNDECFDWFERHEPTRDALLAKNYNVILEEQIYGGHSLSAEDAHIVHKFLSEKFEY